MFHIKKDNINLKIELQNYFENREGDIHKLENGLLIDNLENILSNKVTTFCNRYEAKDLFDILCIAESCNFDWKTILIASNDKKLVTDEYNGSKENFLITIKNFDLPKA